MVPGHHHGNPARRQEGCVRALGGTTNLDHSQDIELTYISNAIEGNTLTAVETTMVVEHGITVAGKPLRDHLEAIDHFEAIRYVRALARQPAPLTEVEVSNLHRLVVLRSRPDITGCYADQVRYVLTDSGRHAFPSPAEIPALMGDFERRHAYACAMSTSTRPSTSLRLN
jgi:Fic family protein